MNIKDIKELFDVKPSIWLGSYPPYDTQMVNILHSSSYRLAQELHGKYKIVWFYESLLSNNSGWKIIVDEMIRLIKDDGIVVIRFEQNNFVNIIELKNYFGRSKVLDNVDVIYQKVDEGIYSIVFKIKRKNFTIYQNKAWSFAVLTQGNKVENVINFCDSVRKNDMNNQHEIIICGPKNALYDKFNVKYIEKEYRKDLAEISMKKNDIINMCQNDNLLIAHDRYILNDDFFIGFERYGYDFDFLTIRQQYENGKKFPSYLKLEKNMKWSSVLFTDDESLFDDNFFLNGGLLIFKKKTIQSIYFNKLLFWNEAEDVELSYQMINNSIPPRQNYLSSATTIGINPEYTATFIEIKRPALYKKFFTRLFDKSFKIIKRILPQTLKNHIKKVLFK